MFMMYYMFPIFPTLLFVSCFLSVVQCSLFAGLSFRLLSFELFMLRLFVIICITIIVYMCSLF